MGKLVDIGRWRVVVLPRGKAVSVRLRTDLIEWANPSGWHLIYPPNWIERLRGISWQQKIDKARQRVRRFAVKLNREEQAAKDICEGETDEAECE